MKECIELAGTDLVTCAIRRVPLDETGGQNLIEYLKGVRVLPNTAMCYNVKDAVLTAQLARELLDTNWVKLEVIGDADTLFPDNEGTLEAAKILIEDGFTVLPYCSDDLIVCQKLEQLGCPAVMPLAAPIGSGLGIRNPHKLTDYPREDPVSRHRRCRRRDGVRCGVRDGIGDGRRVAANGGLRRERSA